SISRSWPAASGGPSVRTVTEPPDRSVICTASSTAHSSCGLTANPDIRVSTSWPSAVTTTLPPTIGTRFTQTRTSMRLAPDPLVGRVEQRRSAGNRDRCRVLLAHVLHRERRPGDGLLRRQIGHQ